MPVTPIPRDYQQEWTSIQGMEFHVPYGVFIPRPDTEAWLTQVISKYEKQFLSAKTVVDLCSGAGLISAMLAQKFPHLKIISLEINPDAVSAQIKTFAKNNINTVDVRKSDLFESLNKLDLDSNWILISNPPYVPEGDKKYVIENNIEHEPDIAIFGGGKAGLDIFNIIIRQLAQLPTPQFAAFELDPRNILSATQYAKKILPVTVAHHISDINGWHRALILEF